MCAEADVNAGQHGKPFPNCQGTCAQMLTTTQGKTAVVEFLLSTNNS